MTDESLRKAWLKFQVYAYALAPHPAFLLAVGFTLGFLTAFEILVK